MSTAKNKIFHYAKVGIGTESPQKQLQILGDSDTCLRITSSSNGVASLQLGDVDDTVKGAITFLNSDNSLRIRGHNNDDRISIKSGGQVNIGGDYDNTTYPFKLTGSGGGDAAAMAIQNLGSHPAKLHLMSGHGNWSVSNSTTVGDAFEVRDEGANSTRMMINSGGKVKMTSGTNNQRGLSVIAPKTQINFGTAEDVGGFLMSENNGQFGLSGGGYWSGSNWVATHTGSAQIRHDGGGAMVFCTNASLTSGNTFVPSARLTIDNSGNMCLGGTPFDQGTGNTFCIHSSGTGPGDHAYIYFTNGDSGHSASDGMSIGIAANAVANIAVREAWPFAISTNGSERVRINSTGTTTFYGDSNGTEQVKIQSSGGGTGLFIGNFQGLDAGDASSRLGVGKNDNALIFTNASGSQISNFAIGNTDSIPLILSTANTRRIHIRGDGKIIMGTGIPTYTNSIVHVEGAGINFESSYTLEDGTGASPLFSIFGSNSHVRIDMGTLNVAPYAGYIQARFDNDPEQTGTSAAGREPLMINPKGGVVTFNLSDSNATSEIGGGSTGTQGGIVMRAGRANTTTVNNASTAIKIFPGEVRAYSGSGGTGEQNQGTKYGGIAWNVLDPHHSSWGTNHDGHHCWMGMSLHSTPGQELSNWQVQMNNNSASGSYATKVAIQANPEGYITKPNQPSFYVRRSTGGDNRAAGIITEWSNPGTTESSSNPVHNRGGHFNYSTGKFTAPINGIYHFDAAAGYKQVGYDFNQKLYINGGAAAEGVRFIDGGDDLVSHSTACMSLTCYLHKGDEVTLELGYVHHVNTTYNYFSGYLVQ